MIDFNPLSGEFDFVGGGDTAEQTGHIQVKYVVEEEEVVSVANMYQYNVVDQLIIDGEISIEDGGEVNIIKSA